MANYLDNDIKFVAGVGEARARLLEKELGIRTLGDMLCHYPFRYIDRTRIYRIDQIAEGDSALIQFRGRITGVSYAGAGRKRRFTAVVNDGSGVAELVWFQGIKWIEKRIEVGREYLIFGRPSFFKGELSVVHPEIETIEKAFSRKAESGLQGIYSSTERLSSVLGTKGIYTIVCNLWPMVRDHIRETLPDRMRTRYGLLSLRDALYNIHFPQSPELLRQAQYRLKFEELLGIQLGIQSRRTARLSKNNGFLFPKVGGVFNTFFNTRLPFPLTGAQKQFDEEEARKAAVKISDGSFGLDDFLDQLQQVRKLGPMKNLLGMIPGMAAHRKELEQFDEKEIDRTEAIIRSMTPAERRDPSIIDGSRRARIAYGSGVTVSQVNGLLQRFEQAAKMMRRMSNKAGAGIPGFGGPAMGGGKGKGKGKKNKKKGGKSGNPMKREAEEKALRDKLAGKNSGGSSSGSAFAKKPQNPALPAGLQDMMGDSGELPPNFGGGLSGLLH